VRLVQAESDGMNNQESENGKSDIPELRLSQMLYGPQRTLSPDEVRAEVQRLLAICGAKGVQAIAQEACACRELLEALAEACHSHGMAAAGQYLDYLASPYD
jgi:hypothetical protein